jgi:3-hydroxyisobutyrate dehydrogenase
MGAPMCRNLLKGGFELCVWNRSPEKAEAFKALGARVAATPGEAGAFGDVVLLCVPTQAEVRELLTRADGLLAHVRPGSAIVDCSTIDPNASVDHIRMCAEHGIDMIEAPLSGGTVGAEAGTLTLMAAGDERVLERVRPVLEAVGKNIFFMGAAGAGQVTKLCNNLIMAAQMVAVAEAYTLLDAGGIDPKKATDVFLVSTANCTALARVPVPGVVPNSPASNGWKPGFATEWMAKDLDLAQSYAKSVGAPVLQVALNHQVHRMAIQEGYAKLDLSTIGKMLLDRLHAGRDRE